MIAARSEPQNAALIAVQIAVTRAAQSGHNHRRHAHPTPTRKPWCERPHPFRRGATPRARRRGRSHHGLLTIADAVAC